MKPNKFNNIIFITIAADTDIASAAVDVGAVAAVGVILDAVNVIYAVNVVSVDVVDVSWVKRRNWCCCR